MALSLRLPFLAPLPVGHRVQVIWLDRYVTPLFGGAAHWHALPDPVLRDRDTGGAIRALGDWCRTTMTPPPNEGFRIRGVQELRVTSCRVVSEGGERALLLTELSLMQEPGQGGYR